MSAKSLYNKIINNGVRAGTSFSLLNKLRVFNSAILAVFFINVFYDVVGLVQSYFAAVAVTTFCLLSMMFSFLLVRKGKYLIGFHFTIISALIFLSGFTILFGGANSSYYYFLFVPVAANILFDSLIVTISYFTISTLLMIVNVYYFNHFKPYYNIEEWMGYFSYPNIFFAGMLIFLGVRLFKQENIKYSDQIEDQKKALEEKNKEITDSITYAKKIQSALIPSEDEFNSHFKESFVLFKPKDIVSGDFYWITKKDNKLFFVTGDCTGHGVPGAFMTMLCISYMDEIINEKSITEPCDILNALRDRLIQTLKQTGTAGENKDGMDAVLCRLDLSTNTLCYAAANNSLYILRNSELIEHKGNKQPCGFHHEINSFEQKEIKLQSGDSVFAFTDGFPDQFGGPKGKKFKYKQLEQLVISNKNSTFKEQKMILENSFDNWRGDLEQIDDVCIVGIKI